MLHDARAPEISRVIALWRSTSRHYMPAVVAEQITASFGAAVDSRRIECVHGQRYEARAQANEEKPNERRIVLCAGSACVSWRRFLLTYSRETKIQTVLRVP